MDDFAAWLKIKRTDMGLTQTKFGEFLGVTTAAIMHWETGKHVPRDRTRRRIERILNGEEPTEEKDDPSGYWYIPPTRPGVLTCGRCKRTTCVNVNVVLRYGHGWPRYCCWCGAFQKPPKEGSDL